MVTTGENDVASLPLVPANPLPFKQRLAEIRKTHSCQVTFRESGGQVTRVTLGPRWLAPPIVWVMSPAGARDVLGRKDDACDRTAVHREMRLLMGDNLADLPNAPWLSRKRTLQPLFTKQYVRLFGEHMAGAAAMIADGWRDGAEVDLDAESRRLTMRALGRSVLGTDPRRTLSCGGPAVEHCSRIRRRSRDASGQSAAVAAASVAATRRRRIRHDASARRGHPAELPRRSDA